MTSPIELYMPGLPAFPNIPGVNLVPPISLPSIPNLPNLSSSLSNLPEISNIPGIKNIPGASKIAQIQALLRIGTALYDMVTAEDNVAVYDAGYNQVFLMARPMEASVDIQARLMDHPLEDGAIKTDFRVMLPVSIDLTVICKGQNPKQIYQQIRSAFTVCDEYIISLNAGTFKHMVFQGIPHKESPDRFNVISMNLKFREAMIGTTKKQALPANQVANINDQSTLSLGSLQSSSVLGTNPLASIPGVDALSGGIPGISTAASDALGKIKDSATGTLSGLSGDGSMAKTLFDASRQKLSTLFQ